jgi:alkane 1-monooxygenase
MKNRQDANIAQEMGAIPAQAPLSFFIIYLVAGSGFLIGLKGGFYTLAAPLGITFVAVPIVDVLMGIDTRNAPERPPGRLAMLTLRLATWLAIPAQAAMLLWGAWVASRPSISHIELAGVVTSVGVTGGVIGITVAHELIHRSKRADRVLGGVLLVMVFYVHWAIEHVAGHHHRVATREDPATARLGEPLPAFVVRSVAMGFLSAWQIETARNARRGIRSPLRNRVLWSVLGSCALAALLGALFGPRAVAFFFAESAVAIAFLETVNYIEHYGLERRLLRPGVYERVTPLHSWNASHRLTNALLFNLQRHSDHHVWPTRPYYTLRHHAESPQLPLGYAGMALLAMVPPLWRRVMDPRVEAHRARLATIRLETNVFDATSRA